MAYPQSAGAAVPQKASKTGIIWAIVIFAVTAIIGIVMIAVSIGIVLGSLIQPGLHSSAPIATAAAPAAVGS